jgi:hypothetical protein
MDCQGLCFGSARINDCGICVGGTTGVSIDIGKGCDGVCASEKVNDDCGVCGGNGALCRDCNGIRFDNGGNRELKQDLCGVCGGDNSSCSGCDGVAWSGKEFDKCSKCGGTNECCGENGNCNGGNGICSSTVKGCICNQGWTGPYCTVRQDACLYMNCGEHGRCSPITNKCDCDLGWIGERCDLKSCSGHGLYNPTLTECECFVGYTGADCDKCNSPPDGESFVCVLTPEKYFKKPTGVLDEDGPLKFVLALMKTKEVWAALYGVHSLSNNDDELVILPAAIYEEFVYGCDCLPAYPYVDREYQGPMNELVREVIKQNQMDNSFGTLEQLEKYVKRGLFVTTNKDGNKMDLKNADSPFAQFKEIPYSGRITLIFKLFGKTKPDMEPLLISDNKMIGKSYRYTENIIYSEGMTDPMAPVRMKLEQEKSMVHVFVRSTSSTTSEAKVAWTVTMIIFFVFLIIIASFLLVGIMWILTIRSSIDALKSSLGNI